MIERHGDVVALPASKKTRALLGYLATLDRPVRRERLCTLLWELPDDPRGALRWSLSKLRAVVDDDDRPRLIADRETVHFDGARCWVDWRALRDVAKGDIAEADTHLLEELAGGEGEFLEGFDLANCDGFNAWLVAMREDTRLWRIAILRELVQRVGGPESALAYARQWAQLDPADALARSAVTELLEKTGRSQEAAARRESAPPVEAQGDAPAMTFQSGVLLPAQPTRFCFASDGTGLAYSLAGEGPPLVKTANWLNHLDHDWDSPLWRHWIREFTQFRLLIRYDERGNGLSDWDTPDISFESFVDDLESVVEATGIGEFDLLGMSQGASVSIAYALRHPGRVRRLVLYGGYALGWGKRARRGEIERREAMLTLTRSGWGQNNPAFRQMFTTLFLPDATAEEIDWFNELQRLSTSPENAVRLQRAFAEIDVRDMLAKVEVPTLVLHPRDDSVVPFALGRELAATIPGAQFVPLESRNHMVLENEPAWRRAIDCIREFLA